MRAVFASEKRIIHKMLKQSWGVTSDWSGLVHAEWYEEPKSSGLLFNRDFVLEFAPRPFGTTPHACAAMPILPNTLGSELFLTVEAASYSPVMIELMGGQAFPERYFGPFISHIESTLSSLRSSRVLHEISMPGTKDMVRMRDAAYCRILVLDGDICFLVFTENDRPFVRGQRYTLARSHHDEIDCYIDRGSVVCFDGWISHAVEESEYKLVATMETRKSQV